MEFPTALSTTVRKFINQGYQINNLDKPGSGLDKSPTVMIGEATTKTKRRYKKGDTKT
jgi:hypothetical protein